LLVNSLATDYTFLYHIFSLVFVRNLSVNIYDAWIHETLSRAIDINTSPIRVSEVLNAFFILFRGYKVGLFVGG
jgi:hypothetical protein